MSRSFLTPINLNKLELQNARIQNLASAPSSPVAGQIYYDTALLGLYVYNGTSWSSADGLSSGVLSARPLATSVASGTFYYATDNYLIYYSNGTTWQQVNNFGSGSSTTVAIAGTAADGTSTNFARADHSHAGPGFAAPTSTTTYGLSAVTGSATTVARSDHTHGTPALSSNAATSISATTSANGSGTAPAKDDHVHGYTPANFALSAFGVPTGAVAFNSQKITGLAEPTAAQDAATKNYVDGVAQGLNVHDSALVATIANLAWTYAAGSTGVDGGTGVGATLTNPSTGASAIDGYTVVLNDRVLVKNQTTKTQNGIYYVSIAGTTGVATVLTRATDADNHIAGQVTAGDFVFVAGVSGTTTQTAQGWSQIDAGTATTPPKGIKIGTDNIEFSQFSGVGTYTASNGVALTSGNFTFSPLSTGGLQTAAGGASIKLPANSGLTTDSTGTYVTAGTGLSITGGTISLTSSILQKYSATIGDGSSTIIAVTHSLNSRDVQVTVYDAASYNEVMCDVVHTSTSVVTLTFSVAPTSSAYRVVVIG